MEKQKYSEKLRNPRWQKKRLEILERDGFTCRTCGDTEKTLNVHHCYYQQDKNPWDYDNESLITLCENCHLKEKEGRSQAEANLLSLFRTRGFSSNSLNEISSGLRQLKKHRKINNYQLSCILSSLLKDGKQQQALAVKYGTT